MPNILTIFPDLVRSDDPERHKYDTERGYRFQQPSKLLEALSIGSNQGLASIGEAVLATVFKDQRPSNLNAIPSRRGEQCRNHYIDDDTERRRLRTINDLARRAQELEIDKHYIWTPGRKDPDDFSLGRVVSAALAIVGAVWSDSRCDVGVVLDVMGQMGLECPAQATLGTPEEVKRGVDGYLVKVFITGSGGLFSTSGVV